MLVGMQKITMARAIQARQMPLIRNPKRPREKAECLMSLRPRRTETKMGSPYPHDRQMVATPVKLLNAAVEPK